MTSRRLDDKGLAELLALVKGADSVELKLTVPDSAIRSSADALNLDPIEGELRQVIFFDTADLSLDASGVVVRARRIQGGKGDTVVKLRPILPDQLPAEVRDSPSVGVEVDAMPGGFVCSASMKGVASAAAVRKVAQGEEPATSIFSKEQRRFFKAHAGGIDMDQLAVLGPINIIKLKFAPKGFDRRMVAEFWMYPNGSRILELSTKCLPAETFQVAAETRAFLTGRGLDLGGDQQAKTKTALKYFSSKTKTTGPSQKKEG